jgi:hypothetical protein
MRKTGILECAKQLTVTIGATAIALVSHAVPLYAHVKITYPATNATVSGIVSIKATVTHDYSSQLVIDGVMVASAAKGKVAFTWDSTTTSNGSHSLVVKGVPKKKPATLVGPSHSQCPGSAVGQLGCTFRNFAG